MSDISSGNRLKKINGKYYDFKCGNKSFTRVALELKALGVKEFYFMLEVRNPVVMSINPWDPNITADQIKWVILECVQNPWYFLREISMIPVQGGPPMHYSAHRGNIAQAWCALHGYDSDLNIPRQCGKTQSAVALFVWAYLFGTSSSQAVFINKDEEAAKTNLNRLKTQLELLPKYLRFDHGYSDEDGKIVKEVKNAKKIRHPLNSNEIIIKGKASTQEAALNIARGLTAPLIYYDEFEFTSRIKTIIENSAPVYVTAAINAEKNHAAHWRIFTSTPGDLDTPSGQESSLIVAAMPKWTDKIYNMTPKQIDAYIKENGENSILYIECSYQQIGKTEEWFDSMAASIGDALTVKREILLQRLRGSNESPFDRDDIEYLNSNKRFPDIEEIICEHFRLDLYEKLDKNIPYLVGVDCSTGANQDNNAMTIVNPYTLCVAAEFKCCYIGEVDLVNVIVSLVEDYIPRAILCIERNSVGDAVIDMLLRKRVADRLYYDRAKDLLQEEINRETSTESILKKKAGIKSHYGVFTGPKSRERMFAILQRHVCEFKDKIYTANLVDDICSLVKTSSGKTEAAKGKHDDCVMSYLMAMYVYYHGDNLLAFGLKKGSQEIDNQNQGLTFDESTHAASLVPADVLDAIKKQEAFEAQNNYDNIYAEAMEMARRETNQLVRSGLIDAETNTTVDEDYADYNDSGVIPLDFIIDLNG